MVTESEAPPRPPATAAPEKVQPPRLHDTNVTLQALAWSSDPARRMAVINGQMVYEGSTVAGYTVAAIAEEGVVLQRGGQRWLLTYGH